MKHLTIPMIKRAGCILGLLLLATVSFAQGRPNVIYILADDLGYGDLSCYGQKNFSTPNIDRLAARGMKFTQHYAGTSVCAPSRCSLMTGLHTGHTAVRGNSTHMVDGQPQMEGQSPMPASTFTLAHLFRNAGYATGLFGKWGLGAPGTVSEPLKMGFDRFYGFNCQKQAHHYYPYFLWNDHHREMLWNNFGLERGDYAPDLIQKQALKFIETHKAQPFFIYYAPIQPHAELLPPEKYMAKYRGKFMPEKSFAGTDDGPKFRKKDYASQPEGHAAYAAMIHSLDDAVGELVAKLEELGLAGNTLILFSSDNGPHQEAGADPAYFNSNGGLRGIKRDLYEGGMREPMIACWPGHVKAGTTSDLPSAFWDVLPTMAELTRQTIPHPIDGISLLPTLLGKEGQKQHDYLYWEFHEKKGRIAIRQGQWKAVRYNVSVDPASPLELYDLSADPRETTNIAMNHADVVARLDALLKAARTPSANPDWNFEKNRKSADAAGD
ncbi:MAG: hypothetical protein RL328_2502 [Acidobacteriota bacterium]|jgi:arylsulfatase A